MHLHDNDKSDDLHLLPFDGTIDWERVVTKLKECNYKGPVVFELLEHNLKLTCFILQNWSFSQICEKAKKNQL